MNQGFKFIIACIFLLGIGVSSVDAQQNSIKLYTNFLFLNSEQEPRHFDYTPKPFSYRGLSLAYQLAKKEKMVHEWEVGIIYNEEDTDSLKFNRFDIHVRYEVGKDFKRKLSEKLDIRIAAAVKLFYLHEVIDWEPGRIYQRTSNAGGINYAPFAHLEYAISKRLYVDLNATLGGITFGVDFQYTDNPNLTDRQKKQGGFDFDALKENLLRIGVGYRFGAKSE